ncbi:hypothetical protein WG924_28020, partial [Tistrella sp. 25B02-3]
VTASDPDGDALSVTVDDARFEVVGGQLKLRDGISLDHEAEPSVTVVVTAVDAGGLTASTLVTISVTNVNEVPAVPVLDGTSVAEGVAGAVVGLVTVADPDAGDTVELTVDDARFEIVDGVLKLRDGVSLDFETEATVDLVITATDAGGLSAALAVTLAVGDDGVTPVVPVLTGRTVAENAAGAVIG